MENYARLLLEAGVNVQEGMNLAISAEPVHWEFLTVLAEEAYKMGVQYIHFDTNDLGAFIARTNHSKTEYLNFAPNYLNAQVEEMRSGNWGRMRLAGMSDPFCFANVDQARMAIPQKKTREIGKPLMEDCAAGKIPWNVAALPTPGWGAQVFDESVSDAASDKLWGVMRKILRLDSPDPVATWKELAATLQRRSDSLNAAKIDTLHFEAEGTDLTLGMITPHLWLGGAVHMPDGRPYIPNLPTEETFTAPDRERAEGRVQVTRPVEVLNKPVEGAWFEFKDGTVSDYGAAVGEGQLTAYFNMDKHARSIGEIALVDGHSPIFQSGLTFNNILYDENAACHFALGSGYPISVPGGANMSSEQLKAAGVNQSLLHTDFMIGSPDISVTGYDAGGAAVKIIEKGNFVGDFI